jgi:type I restriction enzyme S subunit
MIKAFEINKSDVSSDYRFEAAFYHFSKIIKEESLNNGVFYNKLKTLCSTISDGEHSAIPRQKEFGVRYLYGRNIKDGIVNFDPNTDSSYITEENYQKFTRIHLKENDILLTIVGTIGKTAVYKQEYIGKAGIPRHIAKIRLKDDCNVSPEYIVAFFLSKLGKWQLYNITTGNIQPLLSIGNIEKLDIPIIKKELHDEITEKERKVVECETQALKLISQAQQLFYTRIGINFKKIAKETTFSVCKSDFADADLWTPMYSNPLFVNTLKTIKDKWQTIPVGEITDLKKGDEVGSETYIGYLDKHQTDVPFVRTSDIVNYEIDQYPDFFIPKEIYNELEQNFQCGDVLFTKDGKIGMIGMITDNDKAIISSGFVGLRLNKKANKYGITPEYLFLALSIKEIGVYASKRRTVVASTIPHLREERLKEIEIPILDKETILEITEMVKQAFKLKDEKKQLITEVRETMDGYFNI